MSVQWGKVLSRLSQQFTDQQQCLMLAKHLKLVKGTGRDPVQGITASSCEPIDYSAIANELFQDWMSGTPELNDCDREEALRSILEVQLARPDLTEELKSILLSTRKVSFCILTFQQKTDVFRFSPYKYFPNDRVTYHNLFKQHA